MLQTALLVGDSSSEGSPLARMLLDHAATVLTAQSIPGALREVRRNSAGGPQDATDGVLGPRLVVVLEDICEDDALGLLREMRGSAPQWRVVIVARRPTIRQAVRFTKAGACDYLPSPLDADAFHELMNSLAPQGCAPPDRRRFFCDDCPPGVPIVGRSPAVVRTLRTLRLIAESRCNVVLLTGETGTGKELAARAVHAWRCGDGVPKRHPSRFGAPAQPFVAVNCAALTATLLESELFGHVRGAFTGADRDKTGLFELAASGTLFLDEISEMSSALQAKLLRALQERSFRKVGGTRDLPCEATIIASSNRDLLAEVQAGRFRKDLYYRLAVFPIALPPLRSPDRRSDVPLLASYFATTSSICPAGRIQGLSPAAEQALLAHDWPGNVRELRNVIERALILERSEWIAPDSLLLEGAVAAPAATVPTPATDAPAFPQRADAAGPPCREPPKKEDFSLETAEREFILRALKETGWQRTRAASLLGITRATLHAKLKRYDIQPPDGEAGRGNAAGCGAPEELAEAQA